MQAGVAQMQECLDGGLSLKSCCRLARTTNFHLATGIYVAAARDWLRIYAPHEILFVSFEEYRCRPPLGLYRFFTVPILL